MWHETSVPPCFVITWCLIKQRDTCLYGTFLASRKSNPYSVPQGGVPRYVDMWIRTLGHVGDVNRCEGDTLLRVTTTHAG